LVLVVGIVVLAYLAIVGTIALAIWGARWYRRRGVEMQEGEWLPWHPWLRRHPVASACFVACAVALLGGPITIALDHYAGRPVKASDYVFLFVVMPAVLGFAVYVQSRRERRAGR
jgi:hypothetical protein